MNKAWRVGVHGAGGRMGRAVIQALHQHPQLSLSVATDAPGSSLIGTDSGELAGVGRNAVLLTDQLDQAAAQCDVVIDFSRPQGTLLLVEALAASDRALAPVRAFLARTDLHSSCSGGAGVPAPGCPCCLN